MDRTRELRQQYEDELSKVEGIHVEARPLMPYMTEGVKVSLPVMFRVQVGCCPTMKRDPVHVCMVLDRSGSMSGAPLENCKTAIKNVMKQLEPTDLISFVVYDNVVQTVFAAQSNCHLASLSVQVDHVRSGGCTNISGGLEHAVKCLKKAAPEVPHHQRIVFLFSDGQANCGVTDLDTMGTVLSEYVKRDGVQITSFGIGSNYSEEWMRAIARAGKGNYFFIGDMTQIDDIVQRGVAGFTSAVARNAVLRVRAAGGHTLSDIQTLTTPEVLLHGYKLNTLRSMGMYTVVANIELNPHPELHVVRDRELDDFEVVASGEVFEKVSRVIEYELVYDAVDGELPSHGTAGTVVLQYTTDDAKLRQRDADVLCHLTMLECVPIDQAVEDALRRGQREQAISLKREVLAKYQQVAASDRFGVIASMQARAENMLDMLEKKNTAAAERYHGHATGWASKAKKSRKKCDWEDDLSEDDEDMGYGLFD